MQNIIILQDFINNKISEIAKTFPELVHERPASFECGHKMGYKQALLDIDNLLQYNEIWINKNKELPQNGAWIVYTNGIWFDVAKYSTLTEEHVRECSSINWVDVTHWMPLNFPYFYD